MEGDEFIGLVWGAIDPSVPGVAHAYQMWVAPDRRGLGVGSMLLDAVIAWAWAAGAQRMVLAVTCGENPARRLYERAGFVPLGDPAPIRPGSPVRSQPMELAR